MKSVAGQKRGPEDFIRNTIIFLPPFSVKRAITEYMNCKTVILDNLVEKIQAGINKLLEYHAALTGKIEVHESAK